MTHAAVIAGAAEAVLGGTLLGREQLLAVAQSGTTEPHELLHWANRVRTAVFGRQVTFCSIVAGKLGGCGEDCRWCAQSAAHNKGGASVCGQSSTATLAKAKHTCLADIAAAARSADASSVGCFSIVNSGRGPSRRDLSDVVSAVAALRGSGDAGDGMDLAASLGELTPEAAGKLAAGGLKRYHHNMETSRRHFPRVVTTHSYDDRLRTLRAARDAGLELCCGGLFGIGEDWEDRVDLALAIRDDVAASITPLNFLHPIAGTPLESARPLEPIEILSIIALFRLAMPRADLKVAGGRHVNLRDVQSWVFYAGATSILVGNYLTTFGRPVEQDAQMVRDLGLELVRELRPRRVGQLNRLTS